MGRALTTNGQLQVKHDVRCGKRTVLAAARRLSATVSLLLLLLLP